WCDASGTLTVAVRRHPGEVVRSRRQRPQRAVSDAPRLRHPRPGLHGVADVALRTGEGIVRASGSRGSLARDTLTQGAPPPRAEVPRLRPTPWVRRWNDLGRVRCSKPTRDNVQPRPESFTPVHASAGSR